MHASKGYPPLLFFPVNSAVFELSSRRKIGPLPRAASHGAVQVNNRAAREDDEGCQASRRTAAQAPRGAPLLSLPACLSCRSAWHSANILFRRLRYTCGRAGGVRAATACPARGSAKVRATALRGPAPGSAAQSTAGGSAGEHKSHAISCLPCMTQTDLAVQHTRRSASSFVCDFERSSPAVAQGAFNDRCGDGRVCA